MRFGTGTMQSTGRVLLASLFLLGGMNKIVNPTIYEQMMNAAGLQFISVLLPLVIVFEILAAGTLALGLKYHRIAAGLLAIFTLATNVLLHQFWNFDSPVYELEISAFFKNIAIAGGLLYYAGSASDQSDAAS